MQRDIIGEKYSEIYWSNPAPEKFLWRSSLIGSSTVPTYVGVIKTNETINMIRNKKVLFTIATI